MMVNSVGPFDSDDLLSLAESSPTGTGSRILIVQPFFFTLSGSEVLSLELASELLNSGNQVAIASWGWSHELVEEAAKLSGLELLGIESPEMDAYLDEGVPDLVWVNQGLVPRQFLGPLARQARFVFAHLSAFHPFEKPFVEEIEQSLASAVFFVSRETEQMFEKLGLLTEIQPERKHILGNPAPEGFHSLGTRPAETLESVLIVSSHVPSELVEAAELLRQNGVDVTFVGQDQGPRVGAAPQRVTPELLSEHDCVVTIGKTVQYGLCAGVPVYCYDYFGGPGWLSEDNFALAMHNNFSGRGFASKSSEVIADEILSSYAVARDFASQKREGARSLFGYRRVLDVLSSVTGEGPKAERELSRPTVEGFTSAYETIRGFGLSHYRAAGLLREAGEAQSRLASAEAKAAKEIMRLTGQHAEDLAQVERLEAAVLAAQAHVEHLEGVVVDAHAHIAARRFPARVRRLADRAVSFLKSKLNGRP